MRRAFETIGWILGAVGCGLILLGIASWPPGGLMFALPFLFLLPGVPLAIAGAGLVLFARRGAKSRNKKG